MLTFSEVVPQLKQKYRDMSSSAQRRTVKIDNVFRLALLLGQ